MVVNGVISSRWIGLAGQMSTASGKKSVKGRQQN